MKKIAVIGGGISGISLAKILQSDADVTVFERSDRVGGLISCQVVDDYLYHTVGGHVFNSKNPEVTNWFWQFFNKETEFKFARRAAKVFINDRFLGYPIEENIYHLEEAVVGDIVRELLALRKTTTPVNFGEFLRTTFGNTLYDIYFKPYNEKIWGVDPDLMPLDWLEGKLPMPDIAEIMLSNMLRKQEDKMVHSYFYYPKQNGSQFIIDRLAEGINVVRNFKVDTITRNKAGELFLNGAGPFNEVVYTGDVRRVPELLAGQLVSIGVADAVKKLKSNGTTNLLCRCDSNDMSWLYIPEKKYKGHRIIYTGNFSENNNGSNARPSCVVEFSNFVTEQEARDEAKQLPGNLDPVAYNHQPNSYVVQDAQTRGLIADLKNELKVSNIHLLGRFAEWEYYNMDKAIEEAFKLSTCLTGKN